MSELGVEKGLKGSEQNLDEGTENKGYTVSKKTQNEFKMVTTVMPVWMNRNA